MSKTFCNDHHISWLQLKPTAYSWSLQKANKAKHIWPNTACNTGSEITSVFCYGFTHYKWHKDSLNYLAVNSFKVKDQGKSVLKYIFPQEVAFYTGEFQDRPIYQRWRRAHPCIWIWFRLRRNWGWPYIMLSVISYPGFDTLITITSSM